MKNDILNNAINEGAGFSRLFELARSVSLSAEEKSSGFRLLRSYMAEHPSEQPIKDFAGQPSTAFGRILTIYEFLSARKTLSALIFAGVIVVLGGSLVTSAARTLPGDVLYPVKINLNEKIQTLTAFSATDRARVDTVQATLRLQEAETLAVLGRLTPETQQIVQTNFDDHVRQIAVDTDKLKTDGEAYAATVVSSDLESALASHRDILDRLASGSATSSAVSSLADTVTVALRATAGTRKLAEDSLATATDTASIKDIVAQANDDARKSLEDAVETVDRQGQKRGSIAEA
ncbi:MAG: hypothetical protein QOG91_195, partial [Candidatus Parcubacteria bacterium]|nr:hypothetical protein [Candidatus Parcubacteria bacterium]